MDWAAGNASVGLRHVLLSNVHAYHRKQIDEQFFLLLKARQLFSIRS